MPASRKNDLRFADEYDAQDIFDFVCADTKSESCRDSSHFYRDDAPRITLEEVLVQ